MMKKRFYYIVIIVTLLIIIFLSISLYLNKDKLTPVHGAGKYWSVSLKSYDKNLSIYTLDFSYRGNIDDINKIKKISFAVGNEDTTQIINVFDTSIQENILLDDGLSQDKSIVFLDFENLATTNLEIKFDGFKSESEKSKLFNNKTLIEINWSYNNENDLENKDTIKIK
jgi:hypothetical protein